MLCDQVSEKEGFILAKPAPVALIRALGLQIGCQDRSALHSWSFVFHESDGSRVLEPGFRASDEMRKADCIGEVVCWIPFEAAWVLQDEPVERATSDPVAGAFGKNQVGQVAVNRSYPEAGRELNPGGNRRVRSNTTVQVSRADPIAYQHDVPSPGHPGSVLR